MAKPNAVIDCSALDAFTLFSDYTDLLRNRTSFNETLLRQCQQPICQALWGFGVPDLSGIGVSSQPNSRTKGSRSRNTNTLSDLNRSLQGTPCRSLWARCYASSSYSSANISRPP